MRSAGQDHNISGSNRQNVSAGHRIGASGLDLGFGIVDHEETMQRNVGRPILLGRVIGRGVNEDRSVTSLDEAVMEMHAKEAGGDGGIVGDSLCNGVKDVFFDVRAGMVVVMEAKGGGRDDKGRKEEEER